MGASLGALAMLHAQRRFPGAFDGAAAPVGQLLPPRSDKQESALPRFGGSRASSRGVARATGRRDPDPVRMTVRHRRGERREQPRDGAGARRAGLRGRLAEVPRRAQLDVLAGRVRPAPARAARGAADEHARADRRPSARGTCSPTATTAGPVLAFPSENGERGTGRTAGMVDALGGLLDDGPDQALLRRPSTRDVDDAALPLEERARRHGHYEWWILGQVVPFIQADCAAQEIVTTGLVRRLPRRQLRLKRADLFPLAICMSGVYDAAVQGWGERGEAVYFNNPMDYVANLDGDHLDWLRARRRLAARVRAGPVGGHDRRARVDQAASAAARREGHPPRGRPLGPRRPARLAVMARADRPSSARDSADDRVRST